MKRFVMACALLVTLAGCSSSSSSDIGTVNIARIMQNWPKFINYQNQLGSDAAAVDRSNAPDRQKAAERDQLRQRYASMQGELTGDVRGAVEQVAAQRHLKLVVTREFVGYGGVDITPDVEKILNITELASPKP